MKKITALEISKQLPMRVKDLSDTGMFKGTIIRFHTVNKVGHLIGNVVGDKNRTLCVIDSKEEFELLF